MLIAKQLLNDHKVLLIKKIEKQTFTVNFLLLLLLFNKEWMNEILTTPQHENGICCWVSNVIFGIKNSIQKYKNTIQLLKILHVIQENREVAFLVLLLPDRFDYRQYPKSILFNIASCKFQWLLNIVNQ